MTHNVECDLEFQPEGVGIDFDKIESHVQARSTKLLKAANCITTPAFEVCAELDVYRMNDDVSEKKSTSEGGRIVSHA
jgi:hypothetical protein